MRHLILLTLLPCLLSLSFSFIPQPPDPSIIPRLARRSRQFSFLHATRVLPPSAYLGYEAPDPDPSEDYLILDPNADRVGLGPQGMNVPVPITQSLKKKIYNTFDKKSDNWFTELFDLPAQSRDSIQQQIYNQLTAIPMLAETLRFRRADGSIDPNQVSPYPLSDLTYGCEKFNIPIPRFKGEAWRRSDLTSIINRPFTNQQSSSSSSSSSSSQNSITDESQISPSLSTKLLKKLNSYLLPISSLSARFVYIDGLFAPSLSLETSTIYHHAKQTPITTLSPQIRDLYARLPDSATDALPYKSNSRRNAIPISILSGKDQCVGPYNSQFAHNSQFGTAAFGALNTLRCNGFGIVDVIGGTEEEEGEKKVVQVLHVSTIGSKGEDGDGESGFSEDELKQLRGGRVYDDIDNIAIHPRLIMNVGDFATLELVQSRVDLSADKLEQLGPATLVNGYTQVLVGTNATVSHSYIEEGSGVFEAQVHVDSLQRKAEKARRGMNDTILESIDVMVNGENGSYSASVVAAGGAGRTRICLGAALMERGTNAHVFGLGMTGGEVQNEMRTNIHHIADKCESEQGQRMLIGGRGMGIFKGRIRVEQSAQQTDSQQLCRTLLMNDNGAKVWCIPSLEIIADDVQCTHGATIADLSDEELFYLRSRGIDKDAGRKLQLFGFVNDICEKVDKTYLGSEDEEGLRWRVGQKLKRLVPKNERAVLNEYSSV